MCRRRPGCTPYHIPDVLLLSPDVLLSPMSASVSMSSSVPMSSSIPSRSMQTKVVRPDLSTIDALMILFVDSAGSILVVNRAKVRRQHATEEECPINTARAGEEFSRFPAARIFPHQLLLQKD